MTDVISHTFAELCCSFCARGHDGHVVAFPSLRPSPFAHRAAGVQKLLPCRGGDLDTAPLTDTRCRTPWCRRRDSETRFHRAVLAEICLRSWRGGRRQKHGSRKLCIRSSQQELCLSSLSNVFYLTAHSTARHIRCSEARRLDTHHSCSAVEGHSTSTCELWSSIDTECIHGSLEVSSRVVLGLQMRSIVIMARTWVRGIWPHLATMSLVTLQRPCTPSKQTSVRQFLV